MENKIKELKAQFENELSAIKDLSELEDIRVSYLGKKGSVTDLLKGMRELSNEDKKAFGQKINELKGTVAERISQKTAELKQKEIEKKSHLCRSLTFQCRQISPEAHIIRLLLFSVSASRFLNQWALPLRIMQR